MKFLLMYSNSTPSQVHVGRLKGLGKNICVVVADSEDTAIRHAADTDVILGHRYLRQTLPYTQRLKWVQSTAAGPHHLLSAELSKINPVLTRCTIFSKQVAWHAFTLALAMVRRIPKAVRAQQKGDWMPASSLNLLPHPKTAMVLGVGCIGRELTAILRSNGLQVIGVTNRHSQAAQAACDELLYGDINWRKSLHRVDLCFITLPLTESTAGLFDKDVLHALPRHAVLVNVGRGKIVDTEALMDALYKGQLGGAALDVVHPVPMPGDPIWNTPNLLITPKIAALHPKYQVEYEEFFEDQVKRYLNSDPLLNVFSIDRRKSPVPKNRARNERHFLASE